MLKIEISHSKSKTNKLVDEGNESNVEKNRRFEGGIPKNDLN